MKNISERISAFFFETVLLLASFLICFSHAHAQTVTTNLTLDQLSTENLGVTHNTATFYLYGGNNYSQERTNTSTYGFNITSGGNFYTTGLSTDLSNSIDLSTLIDQNPNGKHYIFVRFLNQVQFNGVTAYQQPIYGNFSTSNNDIWYTKGFSSDIELTQVAQDVNTLTFSTEQDGNTTHTTYYDIVTLVFQVNRCTRYCGTSNRLNFGSLQQFPNVASYNNTTGVTIRYNMLTLNYFDATSNSSIDLSNIETTLSQIAQNTSNSLSLSTIEQYLGSIDQKLSNLPSSQPSIDYSSDLSNIQSSLSTIGSNTSLTNQYISGQSNTLSYINQNVYTSAYNSNRINQNVSDIYTLLLNQSSQTDYTQEFQDIQAQLNNMNTNIASINNILTTPPPNSISEDISYQDANLQGDLNKYLLPDLRFGVGSQASPQFGLKETTSQIFDEMINILPVQGTICNQTGQETYHPSHLNNINPLIRIPIIIPNGSTEGTTFFNISFYCTEDYLIAYTTPGVVKIWRAATSSVLALVLLVDIYNFMLLIITPDNVMTLRSWWTSSTEVSGEG